MEPLHILRPKQLWSRKARVFFWVFFGVFFLFFVAVGIWAGILGMRTFALYQSGQALQRALFTYDLAAADLALSDAAGYAQDIEHTLAFAPFLSVVPYVGETYTAVLQTLDLAGDACALARDALAVASSVTDAIDRAHEGSFSFLEDPRSYADFSSAERRAALNAFAQSASRLRALRVSLELIQQDVARIDARALRVPEAIQVIERAQEEIPRVVTALEILAPFASVAREFAGVDQEMQFLILYLNNAELRPGGGFIGAYSLMRVHEGDIVDFSTEDSYTPDLFVEGKDEYYVEAPRPIAQYIGIPEWYFRDASWSASFAQTAQDARRLLRDELAFGQQPVPDIHHVVGITPDFIEDILDLVGPISANGATYTSANIYELLQYQVEQGFVHEGIAYEDRKQALKIVSETMVDRLMQLSPSSFLDFFTVFSDELKEKHVVLASMDEETQARLEDAGWAGVVPYASVDDLIFFVDANLGALKTDPVVRRHLTYHLSPTSSGGYRATTTITYTHTATQTDYKTGRYRTYAQLFVPFGSTLVRTSGLTSDVIQADALGMTSFATFLEVELQEQRTISFTYDLPAPTVHALRRGVYTLGVFKQVGAGDNLLTLDLDFATNLVAGDPPEDPDDYGDKSYSYTHELSIDKIFRVIL